MTLDEAINVEKYNTTICSELTTEEDIQYHLQIADWLEELRTYKTWDEFMDKFMHYNEEVAYKKGYNKAIDDFVTRCKCMNIDNYNYPSSCVKVVAEQLKVGGDNGNL